MNKASMQQYLSGLPFFAGLEPEFIGFLAGCATVRQLAADEVIFVYGKQAECFYVLRSGRVSIEVAAIEGPPLQLQVLETDRVLGWSWLIPPYKWHFQARALEPAEVLEFDGRPVFGRCESDSKFGYELLKRFSALMSERIDTARESVKEEWSPKGFA